MPTPEPTAPDRSNAEAAFRWCFESRQTGRITIAQFPNGPLWLFLAALLAETVLHPSGRMALALATVKAVALTIWALDELIRGCNPWRRALGAGALLYECVALVVWSGLTGAT